MEINEDIMRNGFEIFKQSHHRRDVYDRTFQFYSYMMSYGEGISVCYKLFGEDTDLEHDGMVLLRGQKISKSAHDNIVRDFYLVAEYNSWVLRGYFQKLEYVYPKGSCVDFVEFKGVHLREYQLEEIQRQCGGNLVKHFKKFVLGPVRIDRRYTNGSSLYVQINPEDYVLKMSRLVASLQIQSLFNAKTRKRYITDRVYALNLLEQFLASYWNVITDKAKDELRRSIVNIFTAEEFNHFQIYEAAYKLMENVGVIDGARMWIPLEQMLRDTARPGVQIFGFHLLQIKPFEENRLLIQGILEDVEVVKGGLMDGPPELRVAILETAVKHFQFMDAALAPRLLESVYQNITQKAYTEAELSVALIEDLIREEAAASSSNVFCSKPFMEATVKFILPVARSKQDNVRRCANNIIKLIAVISLDANDPYFFSELMECYRGMMNYVDGEFTWNVSPTLTPPTGYESEYDMGKRYTYGLIEHLCHERPSFFGRIEEYLLKKVEKWIEFDTFRDQHAAVESCAMLKPRLTQLECLESCTNCPIARRLKVVIKALESKRSRVRWAGANYLKDLMGLIRSDAHNLNVRLRELLLNLRSTSASNEVKECALSALEALDLSSL